MGVVALDTTPRAEVACCSLVQTDNKLFNKVIVVFAFLCDEAASMREHAFANLLPALLLLSEPPTAAPTSSSSAGPVEPARAEVIAAEALPLLLAVQQFVGRANSVAINLVHQLASLYEAKQRLFAATFRKVTLRRAFDALAEIFGMLIALDDALQRASHLPEAMQAYRRVVSNMQLEPERYGVSPTSLGALEERISRLEQSILHGASFSKCIKQPLDVPGQLAVSNNAPFLAQLGENVKRLHSELSLAIGQPTETRQREELPALVGLFCFHQYLTASGPGKGSLDKRLYQSVWSLCKRVPLVHLCGVAMWRPLDFLSSSLPLKGSSSFSPDAAAKAEADTLKQLDAELPKDLSALRLALCRWLPRFESDLTEFPRKAEVLGATTSLLIQGVLLGLRLSSLLRCIIGGHYELGKPLGRNVLSHILSAIELLRALRTAVDRRGGVVAMTSMHACRACAAQLRKLLLPIKAKLEASKRLDDAALDRLAAVGLLLHTLTSPPDRMRLVIVRLATHVAQLKTLMKESEHEEFCDLLWKLSVLATWQSTLATSTDCQLLFYARDILPAMVQMANDMPTPRVLRTLLDATRDAEPMLRRVTTLGVHPTAPPPQLATANSAAPAARRTWLDVLRELLLEAVEAQVLSPLSLAIETDLRYAQHSQHVAVLTDTGSISGGAGGASSAGTTPAQVRALAQRLGQPPLVVMDVALLPSAVVGHYLDTTFYNLTTVALHDWRTYAEMRAIATKRYTLPPHAPLEFVEPQLPPAACLPGQTMEEGLDVLQIMRNIHVFVSSFRYNLNQQIFVESGSATDGKHLNTVGIRHIAASIRVHGHGMMNTAVNFTFLFLRKKLVVFSQFLFDDHIKSKLIREVRQQQEHARAVPALPMDSASTSHYPYARAEGLLRDVRNLGDAASQGRGGSSSSSASGRQPEQHSVLDQFRLLITEIGNAMGYVRMLRAGGVHQTGEAVQCLPDEPNVPDLAGSAGRNGTAGGEDVTAAEEEAATSAMDAGGPFAELGEPCATAHGLAGKMVQAMRSGFDHGADYFAQLEEIFASEVRSAKNSHLANFYIIVPSLTIAFVDAMLQAKDRLHKKQREAYFTDDGFGMGLAYLLKLLQQDEQFESLYWWDTAQAKYAAEERALQEGANGGSLGARKGEDANSLALKRIKSIKLEFELLECAFCSARIFFR